ncbi:hypothetical protein [Clostridium brassicae]|uniref:Transposase n=1 Tax=Clostridium brassicae TaxID=2999072 RepID=A0ABT4DAC7_9CLOT|nr:hypothetical protein [Clostridium brassicae]MCY6957979.1 hypothetical protein [Clostridium brassicae]
MEQMLIMLKHSLKELVFCLVMLQVAGLLFYMLIPKSILKSFRIIGRCIKTILIQAKNACLHLITNYKNKKQLSYGRKKVADGKIINLSKYQKAK